VKTYIQTRGKNTDYAFLASAPSNRWWTEFQNYTSFEKPTLILKSDERDWSCYISGIASARRDRVGSVIRFTIVLEGKCNNENDNQCAIALVKWWLDLFVNGESFEGALSIFDQAIDEVSVEKMLGTRIKNSDTELMFENCVKSLFLNLSKLQFASKINHEKLKANHWLGSIHSKNDRDNFLRISSVLLNGNSQGSSAVFNFLENMTEARDCVKNFNAFFLLINEPSQTDTIKNNDNNGCDLFESLPLASIAEQKQHVDLFLKWIVPLGIVLISAFGLYITPTTFFKKEQVQNLAVDQSNQNTQLKTKEPSSEAK
jgi:hypothetical protein